MVGLRGVRVGRARDGEEDCDEEEHAPAEHLVGGEIWAERSDREHARVSVPTAERARATSYGGGRHQAEKGRSFAKRSLWHALFDSEWSQFCN